MSSVPSRKRAIALQATCGYLDTGVIIIQGLVLVPFYLHFIGAHVYGLWLASGGVLGMLGLVNFGISSFSIQRIARDYGRQNLTGVCSYFTNGLIIYLFISLMLGGLGWAVSLILPEALNVASEHSELLRECFQLAVAAIAISIINECLRSFAQALLRPLFVGLGQVVGRLVGIAVTVWLLFSDSGLWAIPAGMLIAELFVLVSNCFYAFVLYRQFPGGRWLNREIIREYFRTSPALLMARVGGTLSQESEPVLITLFLSPEITSAYMITRRAADIVFRMLSVVVSSTTGSFSHLAGGADPEKTKKAVLNLLFLSFFFGVIGFATYVGANTAFVLLWVGESFLMDQIVIALVGIGFLSRSLRGMIGQMLYGLGDFKFTSMLIFFEGVFRMVLAAGLVNIIGIIGIPVGFLAACLVAFLVLGRRLMNRLGISLKYLVIARFMLTTFVLFGASIVFAELDLNVDAWAELAVYIIMLMVLALFVCVSMNPGLFWKMYKGLVTR